MQFSEYEVLIYLKEMPVFGDESPRFFQNKELCSQVNLTAEEIQFFEDLEPLYIKKYGLDKESYGAYVDIEIYEIEDFGEEDEVLHFIIYGGVEGHERQELGLDSYSRSEGCLME